MKWIGQHIYDLIARFRNDVYLEDISTGTIASGGNLGLDSNNKIVKATISSTTDLTSDVTGVLPASNGGTGTSSYIDNQVVAYNAGTGKLEGHNVFVEQPATNAYKLKIGDGSSTSAILGSENGAPLSVSVDLATGANAAGSDLTLTAGLSTGTAEGGNILFKSSTGGSSGSIPNTNSELVRITGGGNVGIGTTSPGAKLEVNSGGGIHISDDAAGRTLIVKPSLSGSVHEFTSDNTAAGYAFSNNSSEFMRIAADGNVGIGTTSPQKKLDVSGGDIRLDNSRGIFFASTDANISRVSITGDESSDFIRLKVDNNNSHVLHLNTTGVGIGTTSPSEKLEVVGNIKLSGNLDIGGSVQKQIQVFPMNFVDDLGTDKHFMPFVTNVEQTVNYQEEAAMVMPADGRVVSVTVHYAQMHGSDGNITVGIETSPCGQSYTNTWDIEETAVLAATVADDHHVFHFAFDNAKHFESTDKMAISIQQSADMQNANRFFWVTAVVEYDWSTFLAGSNPGQEYTTTP